MDQHNFYSQPIHIAQLRPHGINLVKLEEDLQVIVIRKGEEFLVFPDICPHMGGYLSQGKYCSKSGRLQCPWHGYLFDVDTGIFAENPNEVIWEKLRYPTEYYKPNTTPKYKLNKLEYKVDQDNLYICLR